MPPLLHKFGDFELDASRFELRRKGRPVKIERIPLELLILLAEKNGDVVTRQEIIERLWGKDVFLDTEHGINTAIRKIRTALREGAESPHFLQTVTGKGYRFVIEKYDTPLEAPAAPRPTSEAPPPPMSENPPQPKFESPPPAMLETPPPAMLETPPPAMWGQPPRLSGGADSSRRPAGAATKPAPKPKPKLALALALTLLVAAATLLFAFRHQIFPTTPANQIHSIAVIPLANLSGDPSQEYFADGLTDELITALAKNHNLRVVSRTSAMQFKGVNRPVRDIAKELGVDGILEGSVSRSANRVHMTVQLIHAPSDTHIWAESYDRDLSEIISLPEELSQTIAKEVKTAVSPPSRHRYINPEAHDAYLLGRYYWFVDEKESRKYFQKAIDLQPDYAAAWSGLADYYTGHAVLGKALPETLLPQAEEAAQKALALDDYLPEAHNSMAAVYYFYRWDWRRADLESARAVELNPNLAEAHHMRSYLLQTLNRSDEALQEQKKAMELDPFARPWALAQSLILARQFDAALNEALLRSQAQPDKVTLHETLSDAYAHKGMETEAARELELSFQLAGDKASAAAVHRASEHGGFKAVLEWQLNDLKKQVARGQYVTPLEFADDYAWLHRKDDALLYLEKAYHDRDPWLVHLQNGSIYDFLHSEPRYQAIVKKVGLPPAH